MSISIINANERHIIQLAKLLSTTGYDIATDKYNTLKLDPIQYISEYKIKPSLPFIRVAVSDDKTDNVLGMLEAGRFSLIMSQNSHDHYHENIKIIFSNVFEIYNKLIPESYHIFRFAVCSGSRNKGVGNILFNYAETEAKNAKLDLLTITVWNNQIDAIRFYLKRKMEIKACFHISEKIPYQNLLYLEKNFTRNIINNYFESKEYSNLNLI